MSKNLPKLSILIFSLASGGAERVVSILIPKLKEYFNISLILMNDEIHYDIPSGIKVLYLEHSKIDESGLKKLLKIFLLAIKYKKLCRNEKIEYSLSFMNRPNYINTLSKLLGNKARVFISERIAPSKEYPTKKLKDRVSRYLIRILYPHANKVIPNSIGIKNDLIDNFFVPEDKIKVINNPIDFKEIKNLMNEDINDFVFNNKFTFVNVARMHPQKNQELLIKAFSKIKYDANLVILGNGELEKKLVSLISDLKQENRIFLLGNKRNPFKYIKKSNCFVFTSNYEGFPNAILEALACSLPIISSDCKSGPREILAPCTDVRKELVNELEIGEYGILFPIENEKLLIDAMNLILSRKELYNRYRINSHKLLNKYDKDIISKEFKEILKCKSNY